MKFNSNLLFTILIVLTALFSNAQVTIENTSEIERIKQGTTYITFHDTNDATAKQYMDIYKQYWTISKIKFINYSDIDKYISPENSFFSIDVYKPNQGNGVYAPHFYNPNNTPGQNMNQNITGSVSLTYIYMALWTYNEKYFSKNKKTKPKKSDKIDIAKIILFPDYKTIANSDSIYNYDYNLEGHVRNWSPGMLKNYVQCLMSYLNNGKLIPESTEIANSADLKHLKTDTLFVPDYVLIKFNSANGDETQKIDKSELLGDYSHPYKLLTTVELSNEIMSRTTPFYYMIYVKDCTFKTVTVINSSTGGIVYSDYTIASYNIKDRDMKDISKAIQGAK